MALASGTRLGPYEIHTVIGAGGMGEVYRARDTRLDRDVAIKILPEGFAADTTARERFQREAKTIAGLNHPHICTLHDIGQEGETTFLVMELVEGETLAGIIATRPIPLATTLTIAGQIADALDKAHRAGLAHRDLKPANVMLTKVGGVVHVKLLDFGLAKPAGLRASAGGAAAQTMTASPSLTGAGTIVGTLHYMAPEQLEGKDADPRSDIWAFGCVLYEMLTGARPFEGKSSVGLMAAILEHECPGIDSADPVMFEIEAPSTQLDSIAASPDGRFIVYAGETDGGNHLILREISSTAVRTLPGTEGATRPFWSPDSKSIAFFTPNELKRVDLAGAASLRLVQLPIGNASTVSGSWGEGGQVLFGSSPKPPASVERQPAA